MGTIEKVGRVTKIKDSALNAVSSVKRDRMFMEDVEVTFDIFPLLLWWKPFVKEMDLSTFTATIEAIAIATSSSTQ